MDEAGELEPAWLAIATDGFGGLEEVLNLAKRGVRVRFVDEGVEFLHCLPDGHLSPSLGFEVVAGFEVVGDGLLFVLLAIEVLDSVTGVFVLSKLRLILLGVELGLFIDVDFLLGCRAVLDSHSGLQDVDLIDGIRGRLEGEAILVRVEVLVDIGCLEDRCWCHFECKNENTLMDEGPGILLRMESLERKCSIAEKVYW